MSEVERDVAFISEAAGNTDPADISWEADEDREIHAIEYVIKSDNSNDGDTDGEIRVFLGSVQALTSNGVSKDHNRVSGHGFRMFVDAADGGGTNYGFGGHREDFDEPVEWKEGQTMVVSGVATGNTHGIKAIVTVHWTEA